MENRHFLERAVTHLAGEEGIRQFLDVGTGIPTRPYLHEIAGRHHADARTVYVDNDPFVVVHARALMTAQPPAAVGYLHADLRRPHTITSAADLRTTLDLDEPVDVLLVAVLHFLAEVDQPAAVVAELVDALPAGSHVVMSHATFDSVPEPVADALGALADPEAGHGPFHARPRHQVCDLIAGLDPVGPGLVSITEWRPDLAPKPRAGFAEAAFYGVVACKR